MLLPAADVKKRSLRVDAAPLSTFSAYRAATHVEMPPASVYASSQLPPARA